VLFVLAAGQLSAVLSAEGQGLPSDLAWATAYAGHGPWASLAPEVASHPSQLYEAIGTTALLAALGLAIVAGVFARHDGSALLVGVGGWVVVRGMVVTTWRDAEVLGPLRAEQLVLLVVLIVCVGGVVRARRRGGSSIAVH